MTATESKRHMIYKEMPCSRGELEYVMHLSKSVIRNMTDTEYIRFFNRRKKLKAWAKANNIKIY